ncbi:porin [Agrobacterium vitis]|uniref:carbohydrate porin n=1 Tax=Agrobacterium vitis TaxID=373 RepID=UPI0012E9604A|nr:carbohydrate porin [Agrobacterium vitis]MVA78330.1 porin [Agrobacterium vitis]
MRILYMITIPLLFATVAPAFAIDPEIGTQEPPFLDGPPPVYSGPLAEAGRWLHENGVDLRIDYINIAQSAPAYGFKKLGYGSFLVDLTGNITPDLRIRLTEAVNLPNNNVTGNLTAFLPPVTGTTDTALARFSLEADFLDDRLTIEAGRIGLARDFSIRGFCSGISCINATQGKSLNLPDDVRSVWGGRAAYKLTANTTLGFGLIEDNPDNWQNGDGWTWGSGDAEGYIAAANVRHIETFMDSNKPFKLEAGAYFRSTPYQDTLYNSGWGNPTYGANTKIVTHDSGTTAIYAHARKVVWSRSSDSFNPENIAFYGGILHYFGEGHDYPWEAYAGVEYSGFWQANPLAGVGASVHYIRISEERAEYERNARRFFSGVDQRQSQDMFMFDVHGSTGIFGNGILDFGAAYIINPNSAFADFSTARQKDGVVIYAALAFDLSTVLGLSPRRGP